MQKGTRSRSRARQVGGTLALAALLLGLVRCQPPAHGGPGFEVTLAGSAVEAMEAQEENGEREEG